MNRPTDQPTNQSKMNQAAAALPRAVRGESGGGRGEHSGRPVIVAADGSEQVPDQRHDGGSHALQRHVASPVGTHSAVSSFVHSLVCSLACLLIRELAR